MLRHHVIWRTASLRGPHRRRGALLACAAYLALWLWHGAAQGQQEPDPSPGRRDGEGEWQSPRQPVEPAAFRPGSTAALEDGYDDRAPRPPLRGERRMSSESRVIRDRSVRQAAGFESGLPNGSGQVWKSYPLTAYTENVDSTKAPQQAVIDWVLRETGYEAWHSGETFGVLWADRDELKVYHTPEMQAAVEQIVRRFTATRGELRAFGVRVVTMAEPDWRARATRLVTPVSAQTPGVSAWMLDREEGAMLMADLAKREDFREHSATSVTIHNGQPFIDSKLHAVNYVKEIVPRKEGFPWYEAVNGQVEEGFALEFSPLFSADGGSIDAVVKLHVDQVEQVRPVQLQVETPLGTRETAEVEVPQIVQFRVQERFRWPAGKVLLVSLGMVPSPHREMKTGLRLDFLRTPPPERSELLLLIEAKQAAPLGPDGARTSAKPGKQYGDRY